MIFDYQLRVFKNGNVVVTRGSNNKAIIMEKYRTLRDYLESQTSKEILKGDNFTISITYKGKPYITKRIEI